MTPDDWFQTNGWQPHAFQREVWAAMQGGESGLLHATTGSGKTYAVWMGALLRLRPVAGLQVLWITPMRALASDTTRALQVPLPALAPGFSVGQRSGDTPAAERARQDRRLPGALVTTPESLSLLLTRELAAAQFSGVQTVVVDEWHELIGNKRGVQVQLALARLKRWNPSLVVWGFERDPGQPRRRHGYPRRARTRCESAGAWPCGQGAGHRHPVAGRPGPILLGRAPRRADAATGGGRD